MQHILLHDLLNPHHASAQEYRREPHVERLRVRVLLLPDDLLLYLRPEKS